MQFVLSQEAVAFLSLYLIRKGAIDPSDLKDGTLSEAKLTFDPATQPELEEAITQIVGAQSTADSAQASADSAQASADSAQASADSAQASADSAQATADNAATEAELTAFAADPSSQPGYSPSTWENSLPLKLTFRTESTTGPAAVTTDFTEADTTAAGGLITLELPTAPSREGKVSHFKQKGVNGVTISATGGATIDGAGTTSLTNDDDSVSLFSDGTEWHVIGRAP